MNPAGLDQLTPRHRQCLRLLAQLKSADEIAAELEISTHTVNSYLAEARRLLGTTSSRQAARAFIGHEGSASPENLAGHFSRVEPSPPAAPDSVLPERQADPGHHVRDAGMARWNVEPVRRPRFTLPFFRVEGPGNELNWISRLRHIVVGALVIAMIIVLLSAGTETLIRLGHAAAG